MEEEIRKAHQREGGDLGENKIAIDRFIAMIHIHEKSEDPRIQAITNNIVNLKKDFPGFIIFQGERTFFMHQFKALQISTQEDGMVLSHEFGHGVHNMLNRTEVPEGFAEVVKRARAHAVDPENRENLVGFLEHLCGDSEERTEAEKGPVSDIISSIFQYPSFNFVKINKAFILPSYHDRDYYFNEETEQMKEDKIYDEDFANFYALKAHNCGKELEELRMLFGDELLQILDEQLEKAASQVSLEKAKDQSAMEQIKASIIGVRQGELTNSVELITKDEKSNEGRRRRIE